MRGWGVGRAIRQPLSRQRLAINTQDIRTLLDRVPGIRDACDLDLMLFFYRHPLALLTSDRLATCVGYDRDPIAKALDGLIEDGLVKQSRNPAHAAHLYVLALDGVACESLSSLLSFAVTRDGRLSVMRLLESTSGRSALTGVQQSASLAH